MKKLSDVDATKYCHFYSMPELVRAMSMSRIVWSWGAQDWSNVDEVFLRFKVSGNLFDGYVQIGVNGSDLFDIFFADPCGTIVSKIQNVFIEDLISTIDIQVERIPLYKC